MSHGNLVLGGGVFLAVFVGAWLALPHIGASKAPPPPVEPRPVPTKPLVEETFSDVRKSVRDRGARAAAFDAKAHAEGEREMARRILAYKGKKVPEELLLSAENDAPTSAKYARFAKIEQDGQVLACRSSRRDGEVEHTIVSFTPTEARLAIGMPVNLTQYILSGCAEAMRDRSQVITEIQYLQILSGLLPKTSKYDPTRQSFAEAIREAHESR